MLRVAAAAAVMAIAVASFPPPPSTYSSVTKLAPARTFSGLCRANCGLHGWGRGRADASCVSICLTVLVMHAAWCIRWGGRPCFPLPLALAACVSMPRTDASPWVHAAQLGGNTAQLLTPHPGQSNDLLCPCERRALLHRTADPAARCPSPAADFTTAQATRRRRGACTWRTARRRRRA
jgi:hypothetical protein